MPNTTITAAQLVATGNLKLPEQSGGPPNAAGPAPPDTSSLPAFCRVEATLRPSADSDIKMEAWLPVSGWNGKFYAAGNSGWAGSIPYRPMVAGIAAHYATAGTDTGHEGNNGSFIPGHPEKLVDYGYRADHEMTLRAKELVQAFYGGKPKHSYWVGCSLGGMEALVEADRYPQDYDGIVAGAPMNPMTMFNAAQMWPAWLSQKYPDGIIPAAKFALMHDAVVKACASPIGQRQGFIEDPSACKWDPAALLCKSGDAPDCLTAAQVDMAHRFYAGPVNPRTGEAIFPGPPFGTEGDIGRNGMTNPVGIAIDLYRYAVYQDPDWDYRTMDYDTAITKARTEVDPLMRAGTNLNAFFDHGGKLLLHGGWAEWRNGTELRDYYLKVLQNAGPKQAEQLRLFLISGMGHCGGGNGPNEFDKLGVLDAWVDKGKTPSRLLMSKTLQGKVVRTRPACAWPAVAKYKGNGDEDQADSYVCSNP
ncbi:MAG TPA: tannase/feruloyl esterase family alpha/beta hydrolase [Dyella sp.]|uniref:tannase/feruloyl esterase family alpha/beta hydrolase n=1 Tax=Dyella sp. TaxID=1869338 RepID=UPI002D79708D|nr:tannase/feruloyl esterase family alpha/beta hydrolase [Dyella sp.]HET6554686.1 tannase/feruloyl esterase family alpha/beta hydrolase [Dyella sp.]